MESQTIPFPPKKLRPALYLIGFRMDAASEGPQFYTLIGSEGESERPITRQGRILFFRAPRLAAKALAASDNGFQSLREVPHELEMLCEVGEALHVANQQASDADGWLFELIAVFDDLLRAVELTPPPEYVEVLSQVATRLVASNEFAGFLEQRGLKREKLEDALLWCIGAVAAKSSWVE
jgi:hypothetical protein